VKQNAKLRHNVLINVEALKRSNVLEISGMHITDSAPKILFWYSNKTSCCQIDVLKIMQWQ
jgi:hypothetical protein